MRCARLPARTIDSLNALHRDAHAAGWPELADTPAALGPAFVRAQRDLALTWTAHAGRPKRTLFNFYFTRVSIDGMTGPFFLETLANETLLPFERAATVAHEWSHLAGYADESEANFVGWLVCMRGPAPVQYSGWLSLYGTVVERAAAIRSRRAGRGGSTRDRAPICAPFPIASGGTRFRPPAAPATRSTIDF